MAFTGWDTSVNGVTIDLILSVPGGCLVYPNNPWCDFNNGGTAQIGGIQTYVSGYGYSNMPSYNDPAGWDQIYMMSTLDPVSMGECSRSPSLFLSLSLFLSISVTLFLCI